jgi:hypothetical protein
MDIGIHLHRLGLAVRVPEGECRGSFSGIEPIGGQGGKEIIPLALDGVFFIGDGNVPPGQLFVHQINNE